MAVSKKTIESMSIEELQNEIQNKRKIEQEKIQLENNQRKRSKQHPEFSKIMLVLVTIMSLLLTFFGSFYMWHNHDSTLFSYIIGGWFVELTTATAFYYNKAKTENTIKIQSSIANGCYIDNHENFQEGSEI